MADKPRKKYGRWVPFDEKKPNVLGIVFEDKTTLESAVPQNSPFLAHYGLKQWIASAYAAAQSLPEYKSIVREMFDRAARAEWQSEGDGLGFIINVVAWLKKKPEDAVRAAVEGMSEEELANLKSNPAYKVAAAEYRAHLAKKVAGKSEPLVIKGL